MTFFPKNANSFLTTGSAEADHIPSYFLKTVFHKSYLVHSWILCPIFSKSSIKDVRQGPKYVSLNPLVSNAPFLYPLKASENRKIFWCFQKVENGCIGKKWVED